MLRAEVAREGRSKTYLDTPHLAVRKEQLWVLVEVRARASSEDLRTGLEMCIRALDVTQAGLLLMDLRKMRVVLVDDERWLAEDFLPRLARTTLRRLAIVLPENALARAIVADLAKPRPTGAESLHCKSVREAEEWLSRSGQRTR